ncbi:hypothetical protein RvY_10955-2 [Ramazzottius varieornatus]|uniref:Corticotropin-releasing factor domain-containing protein n=1 Tax=Ramazzottius varieornatus TaxID=947166 RepID=A0A1D1VEH6_RAMVA|nr:hypothetical protein RvY_10955-2 [Ramazzottius varieornatus]
MDPLFRLKMAVHILLIFVMIFRTVRSDPRSPTRPWTMFKKDLESSSSEGDGGNRGAQKGHAQLNVTLNKLRQLAAYYSHRGRPR